MKAESRLFLSSQPSFFHLSLSEETIGSNNLSTRAVVPAISHSRKIQKPQHKKLHENRDIYRFHCRDWSNVYNPLENPIRSEVFHLCGNAWMVEVYTIGTFQKSDHVAIRLLNMSDVEILASYSLILVNEQPTRSYTWTDPEGKVIFQPRGSGDNSWGPDEFILIKQLKIFYR